MTLHATSLCLIGLSLLLVLSTQAADVGSSQPQAVDLGSQKHLFIDDTLAGSGRGVRLAAKPPLTRGPVTQPERAAE